MIARLESVTLPVIDALGDCPYKTPTTRSKNNAARAGNRRIMNIFLLDNLFAQSWVRFAGIGCTKQLNAFIRTEHMCEVHGKIAAAESELKETRSFPRREPAR
jgi:hypothetical protein